MKKNILITGSTDGIGKLTALKLAKEGHSLFLHGRDPKKLEATIIEIRKEANTKTIFGSVADFSDLQSVCKMAKRTALELPKLDVLINNAGVFKSSQLVNSNGIDLRLVVNYLAPYLFTQGLLPVLKKATAPRIINLSSAAQASVSLEALKGSKTIGVQEGYAQSKLALTMWSFDLAQKEKDVTIIAVNPGSLLNTKMVKEAYGNHWSSADKGASLLYDLAILSEFEEKTGLYFDNDKGDPRGTFGEAHADAYNEIKIGQLISATEELLTRLIT
ncbi:MULTISPECIES: SDR family NAD(P)-dependent oxidoreductase [Croceitalea]|uniref:SDR family NAD(P)-dependent oxidoreductase n=1 Tax=Croceitalea vernalis TaxID=3075599 RepID=A0ABU3BK23_9FLAO|nr:MULTISPECIES: SDR family NAD(P)-dependent oxidoreductase [unclassified Croceitalea]MDT0540652.1 SDR family NAD(P)-dependent oxidoreductase [Croceitalea sp. P059]MDT0622508.1 SDR family NAD(P)-dependent oxidoreductase [Croceitalea sp. P007]